MRKGWNNGLTVPRGTLRVSHLVWQDDHRVQKGTVERAGRPLQQSRLKGGTVCMGRYRVQVEERTWDMHNLPAVPLSPASGCITMETASKAGNVHLHVCVSCVPVQGISLGYTHTHIMIVLVSMHQPHTSYLSTQLGVNHINRVYWRRFTTRENQDCYTNKTQLIRWSFFTQTSQTKLSQKHKGFEFTQLAYLQLQFK